MKKGLFILAGVLLLGFLAIPAIGDEAKKEGKRRKSKKEDPFSQDAIAFGADLDQLAEKVGLTEEQKGKLQKLKDSRDKRLEKFDKMYQPRLEKAETKLASLKGKGEGPRAQEMHKQLQGYIKGVQANREKLASSYERRMFALLKPEQRAKWNAPILQEELMRDFSMVFLEAKQEQRLESLCKAQAKRLAVPLDPERHTKEIEALKMQAYRTVLNKKQQAEYRKMRAALSKKNKGKETPRRRRKGR